MQVLCIDKSSITLHQSSLKIERKWGKAIGHGTCELFLMLIWDTSQVDRASSKGQLHIFPCTSSVNKTIYVIYNIAIIFFIRVSNWLSFQLFHEEWIYFKLYVCQSDMKWQLIDKDNFSKIYGKEFNTIQWAKLYVWFYLPFWIGPRNWMLQISEQLVASYPIIALKAH